MSLNLSHLRQEIPRFCNRLMAGLVTEESNLFITFITPEVLLGIKEEKDIAWKPIMLY